MSLANDSILVTPGSGATVATHLVSSKEHQIVIQADAAGHLVNTVPTYSWWINSQTTAASKLFGDLFNASGSGKVIDIWGVWAIPKSDVAVTGIIAVPVGLYRTSAVGTGGTAHTYNGGTTSADHVITPWDTTNSTLPSQITARRTPTGGATISALYWEQYCFTDETNAATYIGAFTNLLPFAQPGQGITLNEGQGLLIKEGPTSTPVGSFTFLTRFTLR